jgi:hypothetical protein
MYVIPVSDPGPVQRFCLDRKPGPAQNPFRAQSLLLRPRPPYLIEQNTIDLVICQFSWILGKNANKVSDCSV